MIDRVRTWPEFCAWHAETAQAYAAIGLPCPFPEPTRLGYIAYLRRESEVLLAQARANRRWERERQARELEAERTASNARRLAALEAEIAPRNSASKRLAKARQFLKANGFRADREAIATYLEHNYVFSA